MIDWTKYFDRIYCLHFTPYIERKQLMDFQLNRVGILNSGNFEYRYRDGSDLDKKFAAYIKEHYSVFYQYNTSVVDIMLNHYECIRDAYYRGYKRILIMENDQRFLKDLNKIEQILQNIPQDANLIMFDKYILKYNLAKQFKSVNPYYSTFEHCCSAGCYALDRKGMQKMIYLIETQPNIPDGYFNNVNIHFNGLKCYCSTKNLAVQAVFKKSVNVNFYNKDLFELQMHYKYLQICFDDYMMRKDDSLYYYGDYIKI